MELELHSGSLPVLKLFTILRVWSAGCGNSGGRSDSDGDGRVVETMQDDWASIWPVIMRRITLPAGNQHVYRFWRSWFSAFVRCQRQRKTFQIEFSHVFFLYVHTCARLSILLLEDALQTGAPNKFHKLLYRNTNLNRFESIYENS